MEIQGHPCYHGLVKLLGIFWCMRITRRQTLSLQLGSAVELIHENIFKFEITVLNWYLKIQWKFSPVNYLFQWTQISNSVEYF